MDKWDKLQESSTAASERIADLIIAKKISETEGLTAAVLMVGDLIIHLGREVEEIKKLVQSSGGN